MRIGGIIWLDDIVDKLESKHGVLDFEVREILESRPHFRRIERGHRVGEDVYGAYGQTEAGRYLIVFFVYKKDTRALIVSARDMTSAERRLYERR
ncbi:MAG: BrnT family toxin [Caldilineae bacterium]|nr:BrnT family toxin [Anaerolineae bacterium]MCB0202606.1 BrnT family toxin [Anaerolineae bacterium]MCB0207029.1 BrnT family toxin [Anaerolineae bacterium]MCB0253211.1 BrnT family toxin [Anaerolineae bacterium]MCB9154827.1 BrnT family toxin [Caldilineae bacterium]